MANSCCLDVNAARLAEITPFILTRDEAPNIARCLETLTWAAQILVVDSGSTDGTLDLLAPHPQVHVVQRSFDTHAGQGNFALSLVKTKWVLSLDADYILTPDFFTALSEGECDESRVYFARFRQCINGHPLRRSLYPPRAVLFASAGAGYEQDGHTQRLILGERKPDYLSGYILHDDRKPAARWRRNQRDYAELEARKLLGKVASAFKPVDRLRRTGWVAPLLIGPYVLVVCGTILDGWPGIRYAGQRIYFESLLAWRLMRSRLANRDEARAPVRAQPFP